MFCQDSDIIKSVTQDTNMSGDSRLEEQPIIFYSNKMTTTKRVLIELKNKLKPLCNNLVDFGNYFSENVELD